MLQGILVIYIVETHKTLITINSVDGRSENEQDRGGMISALHIMS